MNLMLPQDNFERIFIEILIVLQVTWLTLIDKIPASNFRMTWVQNYLRFLSLLLVPIASVMPSVCILQV